MADTETQVRKETKQDRYKQSYKKQNRTSNADHTFRKRQPRKFEEGENIFYISTKTNTKVYLEKCNQLIQKKNEKEIILYCLGAAIQRSILLALQICEQHYAYKIHTSTFTTELVDDLEPAADDADYEIQKRFNSALRIRIFRTELLETSDKKES